MIRIAGLAAVFSLCCSLFAADGGFKPLFNGKDLEGWTGSVDGYKVEEGAIVCIPKKGGNLFTKEEFANFHLKFDFQLEAGGNNGLGIRCPLVKGSAAYAGIELQILDNKAEKYAKLHPYQYHGSVYGVVPAKRGFLKPAGEWNHEEVIADGPHIKVILNGHTIVDADIEEASTPKTMDGKDHPGLKRKSGHIGFLGHGSRVAFRNLEIKTLP